MMPYTNNRIVNTTSLETQLLNNRINDNSVNKPSQKFSNILKSAIEHVNKVEQEADLKTEKLVTNKIEDLHDVMISAQKASITIETAVQIQQKVIDAYNEMMRMQV